MKVCYIVNGKVFIEHKFEDKVGDFITGSNQTGKSETYAKRIEQAIKDYG